jgi:hypothetical protein
MINTRKGINLLLIGAVVLSILAINVSADEETPLIHTVSTEDEFERLDEEPINEAYMYQDSSEGERGDFIDLPSQEDEGLLIAPYEGEDNLVAPGPGADGDVFILDAGSQIDEKSQMKTTEIPFNFPAVLALLCVGMIGLLYIASKRKA